MPTDPPAIVINAPVSCVAGFLTRPDNLRRYLPGAIHATPAAGVRWAFAGDPLGRRYRWWLLAPYRAAGTLTVDGDETGTRLRLRVVAAPAELPAADVHRVALGVLNRLRACVEADAADQRSHRTLASTA